MGNSPNFKPGEDCRSRHMRREAREILSDLPKLGHDRMSDALNRLEELAESSKFKDSRCSRSCNEALLKYGLERAKLEMPQEGSGNGLFGNIPDHDTEIKITIRKTDGARIKAEDDKSS